MGVSITTSVVRMTLRAAFVWLVVAASAFTGTAITGTAFAGPVIADKATDDFNLGVSLYRSQRFETAADTLGTFLKDYPSHARANTARLYYALSLSSLEQYGPARELFVTFLKSEPDSEASADARYRLAECSYYLKDYKTAIEQFETYLQKHPQHSLKDWGNLFLGDSLVATQQWDAAIQRLSLVISSAGSEAIKSDARLSYGRALEGQNRNTEAIEQYRLAAAAADPASAPRAWNRIGSLEASAGHFREAATAYDQVIANFPQSSLVSAAQLASGIALYKAGEFDQAITRLRAVPRESPGAAQAALTTALALRELGKIDESRRELAEALSRAADSPLAAEVLIQQAQLERAADAFATAAQIYEDIADRWPTGERTADCLFNAAELRLEAGERDKSQRLWTRLSREFPESAQNPREQVLLGRIYLARSESDKAIVTLAAAVTRAAEPADRVMSVGRYYLTRAFYEAGRHAEVVQSTRQLIPALEVKANDDLRGALALAAMSSLELKQHEDVVTFADQFLAGTGNDAQRPDVTAARAVALARLNRAGEAVTALKELAGSAANNAQVWTAILQAADAALESKATHEAETLFRLASVAEAPATVREAAAFGMAWSLFEGREFEKSATAFTEFVQQFPQSDDAAQAIYMHARSVEEQGDLDRTTAAWRDVFDQLSKNAAPASAGAETSPPLRYAYDAGRQAARGLQKLGKSEEADAIWAAVATRFPAAADADKVLDEWAWMHSSDGRFDKADIVHRQLLAQFPDSPFAGQARLSLAESQLEAGEIAAAQSEFEAIVADQRYGASEKERSLFHLVELHVAAQRWQPAATSAETFLTSYSASPLVSEIRMLAGDAALHLNDPARAVTILNDLKQQIATNALPAQDWHDRVWVLLAEAALLQKDYAKLDELERELLQRSPQSAFAFQFNDVQGKRWKQQAPPDFARAREYFEKVTSDPQAAGTETAARCQFLIAETLLMQSELDEAIKEYLKVYLNHRHDELRPQALFQVAMCESQLGKKDAAIRDFKELMAVFPGSEFATRARAELNRLEPADASP